jgi:hypothetical protein
MGNVLPTLSELGTSWISTRQRSKFSMQTIDNCSTHQLTTYRVALVRLMNMMPNSPIAEGA